jgi:hydroxymethylglutaryl-CoA synthase
MAGIVSYGAYVPILRLSRKLIPKAGAAGERAVANYDEDSITMGVAAAMDCLVGTDGSKVDRLYFASTSMPYVEKQSANIIAMAAALPQQIKTMDVADSLRAGTNAMSAALDAVKSGSAKQALVVASECRPSIPGSDGEQSFGDGAAALMIGDTGVIATIEASYSLTDDIVDVWRTSDDKYVKTWEDRFCIVAGYEPTVKNALIGLMKKNNLKPGDFTKVVVYGPDQRSLLNAITAAGFNPKTQLQEPLFGVLGNTGAAFSLMVLVSALETAKAGDKILLASYGEGCCDVYVLKVTPEIEKVQKVSGKRGMKGHLASKKLMGSYDMYIRFRGLMSSEAARRPSEPS